jgi:hypothetical protein
LNSSFGQQILAQEQMAGGQQIASLPANMTEQFLSGAVPTVTGFAGTGTQAVGTAGGLSLQRTSTPSFWDYFMQGMQAAGPAVGAAFGA